jgi:membrane associated rhomboid family serine protease
MNSVSRQWLIAPSILAVSWALIFGATDYDSTAQIWWQAFVLQPSSAILCVTTTTFFHANVVHLLSNIALVYILAFFLRGVLAPTQFTTLWFILGPLATLISFLSDPSPLVGASAGLVAVLGGALRLSLSDEKKSLKTWFTLALMTTLVCLAPGDRVAHISGLCLGYLLGAWVTNLRYGLNIGLGYILCSAVYLGIRV